MAIPLDGRAAADPAAVDVLAAGSDFVSSPRLAPDGSRLAWLRWDHPNLPWDGTECVVADLDAAGKPGPGRVVAGDASTWTTQPRWSPDGSLVVASEPGEWIGLHRWDGLRLVPLTAGIAAEFAGPDWVFGLASHGVAGDGTIIAAGRSAGLDRLWRIDPTGGRPPVALDLPFTAIGDLVVRGSEAAAIVASPTMFRSLVRIDLASGAWTVVRSSSDLVLDPADRLGRRARRVPDERRPDCPRDPLPAARTRRSGRPRASCRPSSSRATAARPSGASTGLAPRRPGPDQPRPRRPRRRLRRQHRLRARPTASASRVPGGSSTSTTASPAPSQMARRGEVDPRRLAIEGGSASGFTTLAALAFRDVFRAGVSYFGIGNLEAFVAETHKFESRYLERLVGPYPAERERYLDRSPIFHADGISCPVLVLQGLDDRVVPPSEAERIVAALAAKGIPHVYLPFEGEDHGFRQAANIVRAAQAELAFYGGVFGFTPADDLPELPWRGTPG